MKLCARHFEWEFPRPTLVVGVLNVTPDSFSDGGRYVEPAAALERALGMIAEGAEWLDLGGESTRPGATPVSEEEELRRVLPLVEALAGRVNVPISIDTQKPAVARAALRLGASVVNDIAANRSGSEAEAMWAAVAEFRAGYVVMHMQGTPQTMQREPRYGDVVAEVEEFLAERMRRLGGAGVKSEQIVLDVGIGFGKTQAHNLQLLAAMNSFTKLGRPLLLGVSRKSFLGRSAGVPVAGRLPAALACTSLAVAAGVGMVRTHDVAETVQAIRMVEGIMDHKN